MKPDLIKILFVCTYRGGRSQVAQALMQKHGSNFVESHHACFDSGVISQDFVNLLGSHGIRISRESPSVFDSKVRQIGFDYIVCLCQSMGSEMCALFRNNIDKIYSACPERLFWDIEDFSSCANAPEGFEDCVKLICGKIESKVHELVEKAQADFAKG